MSTEDKLLNAEREIEKLQEENKKLRDMLEGFPISPKWFKQMKELKEESKELRESRDAWKKIAEDSNYLIKRMRMSNGVDLDGNPIIYDIH